MAKVIIFGVSDLAELAHYYLCHDSDHEVAGFTVTQDYLQAENFCGLPVTPFEKIEERFAPDEYVMFIPMTGVNQNKTREHFYHAAKNKGYRLISYISSKATVLTGRIGDNCFILEDNTIQPFVTIGNNVVIWSGNHIGHHSIIKDHVFFTSHVVLSGHCTVEPYCFFGVNATIRDGLTIAEGSFVAMATTLAKNTEKNGKYLPRERGVNNNVGGG
ncbi:hypothetical protein AGMMS49959_17800 [Planctomycetales bacterium]|nr:hypothetical protein AGMMS49959_17800 [Planctomycetales bacterium]